jgi:mono/diheme cytochrome c family protein
MHRRDTPRRRAGAAVAAGLLAGSCTGLQAGDTSFGQHVLPLLNSHCVMCHMPGAAQAELSLYPDPWAALVDQPSTQSPLLRVKPGDPEGSYLYRKLAGTHLEAGGSGEHMPFQRELLEPADLAIFRDWIAQGAGNN